MKSKILVIRCLVRKSGNVYVAQSIEFDLACQADTLEEAKSCLSEMIHSYLESVVEAFQEGDAKGAQQLLNRKADWLTRAAYVRLKVVSFIVEKFKGNGGSGSQNRRKAWVSNNSGPCIA